MIRFLQTDNRLVKALLVLVIGAASISMVVYLIPGLTGMGATSPDTFAVVYPHWYSRFFSAGDSISQAKVEQLTRRQLQREGPQYADNPMIINMMEPQIGRQLVQQQVLLQAAQRLGIRSTEDDVRNFLRTGPYRQLFYPDGNFIGMDRYTSFLAENNVSVTDFEQSIRDQIALERLQGLITAGVTVSPQEVRDTFRKASVKIKFDYAVISADDLAKTINPSDADLEAFFKKNAARYADAVPEQRSITYFAFTPNDIPGGIPQPTQQQIQAYYSQHQSEFQVPDQAKARHILIKLDPGADAKTDAAAKAKAEGIQKQLQSGASWTDLAKKYSDDPGSKDSGGELGWAKRGQMVPQFDSDIFTAKIGEINLVKSQFGYHVVQVEDRQTAHTQALNEVLPDIQASLIRTATADAQQNFSRTLTSEAIKNGLANTAAAHHLQLVTTPLVPATGVISSLPDSSQLLSKAFASKVGDPAQAAPTGEGYAIFQVAHVQQAHAPSFADWKSHVLDDYRQEQLPALLSAKTKELSDKAKDMNDLAKAAKAVGAKFQSSDLVGLSGQVPDLGAVGQVAPQLFEMSVGAISGPIATGRTGVVAKLTDKQEPTADEIQKNFDQTRDQILNERRSENFSVFLSSLLDQYKRHNQIRMNAKQTGPQLPGM
jgi:peptidyl-prolyl cis-trans isomerase D